jgi:NADPH:quinone reductase-like Zn-dependent oxidoreductase
MTPLTLPSTYRAWRRNESSTAIELTSGESMVSPDSLGPDDVLMRIRTVSLNFRDVAMIHDRYIKPVVHRGVTGSDCAAEVVATGSAVTKFKCGDRVSIVYDLNNLDNEDKGEMAALGGEEEGVLREYAVYKQQTLVHVPEHLSWEEVRAESSDRQFFRSC